LTLWCLGHYSSACETTVRRPAACSKRHVRQTRGTPTRPWSRLYRKPSAP
jgi:hypothetical protein